MTEKWTVTFIANKIEEILIDGQPNGDHFHEVTAAFIKIPEEGLHVLQYFYAHHTAGLYDGMIGRRAPGARGKEVFKNR
jgi:hypothetical protein